MTKQLIETLDALAAKATPGEFVFISNNQEQYDIIDTTNDSVFTNMESKENAEFICELVNSYAELRSLALKGLAADELAEAVGHARVYYQTPDQGYDAIRAALATYHKNSV